MNCKVGWLYLILSIVMKYLELAMKISVYFGKNVNEIFQLDHESWAVGTHHEKNNRICSIHRFCWGGLSPWLLQGENWLIIITASSLKDMICWPVCRSCLSLRYTICQSNRNRCLLVNKKSLKLKVSWLQCKVKKCFYYLKLSKNSLNEKLSITIQIS